LVKDGKRQYIVFSHDGMLYVRGVVAGDRIVVYGPSGKAMVNAVATGTEFSTELPYQSGYIVRVNDYGTKVVNL
jgi:hypothetical protein